MFRPPVSWGGRSVLEYLCCFPRYFPRGFPQQHLDSLHDIHIFRTSPIGTQSVRIPESSVDILTATLAYYSDSCSTLA